MPEVRSAKTIFCDNVKDWVTIVGYKEGGEGCTYYKRYAAADKKTQKKKLNGCTGVSCPHNSGLPSLTSTT
jgi:hypothetical protein